MLKLEALETAEDGGKTCIISIFVTMQIVFVLSLIYEFGQQWFRGTASC